jgi:MFS family permease
MTGGLLLQAVTSILAGLAPTFPLLIAFRSIGGIGSAAFTVSSIALIIRIAPVQHRGRAMGIYQGGFILGSIAGPGLGGLLAEISLRLPLVVYGIFLLLAAIVSATMLRTAAVPRRDQARTEPVPAEPVPAEPALTDSALAEQLAEVALAEPAIPGEALADVALAGVTLADGVLADGALAGGALADGALSRPPSRAAAPSAGPLRTALRSRAYLAALLANLGVGWVFYGMRSALLPLYISRHLGQSAGWTGLVFLLSALVQSLALLRAGWICDTWGRKPALLLGAGVSILSVAAFTLPISPGVFLLPLLSLGVGGALLATVPGALVGDVAVGRSETIIALFAMVSDFGGIAGPLISGWLTDAVSFAAAFWLACAILASGFVMTLTIGRDRPRERVTGGAPASL